MTAGKGRAPGPAASNSQDRELPLPCMIERGASKSKRPACGRERTVRPAASVAGMSEPRNRMSYGAALASREFRALFAAQTVSISGTSVAAVALTILVYRRTSSPFLSALTFSLGFLPYAAGAGISGLVDRVRPRRLVVTANACSGAVALAMAWPAAPVALLLPLLLCLGLLASTASGAVGALTRSTLSEAAYVPGRSLLKIAAQTAQIGGNAVGGVLVVALGTSGAIVVNAASFLLAAGLVRLGVENHATGGEARAPNLLVDSFHGAREILRHKELRRLLLLGWLVPMFSVAPEALAAPYVAHRHASTTLVGVWLAALPVGMVAGDLAGVRLLDASVQRRLVVPVAAAGFLPYLAFAARPPIPVALALLLVSGVCGMYTLGLDARVRDAAPAVLFARTMGLASAGLMTLQGLGFALAGAIAEGIGPGIAIVAAGGLGLASTAALAWTRPPAPVVAPVERSTTGA
jgi:MFS family permease